MSVGKSFRPSRSSSLPFEHCAAGLGLGDGVGDAEGVGLGSRDGVGLGMNGTASGAGGVLRLMLLTGSSTAVGVSGCRIR